MVYKFVMEVVIVFKGLSWFIMVDDGLCRFTDFFVGLKTFMMSYNGPTLFITVYRRLTVYIG